MRLAPENEEPRDEPGEWMPKGSLTVLPFVPLDVYGARKALILPTGEGEASDGS